MPNQANFTIPRPSLNFFFLQSFFYDKVSYQKVLQKFLRGMAHGRLERRRGFAFNQCQKLCQHLYNRMKFASPTLLLFLQVLLLVSKNLSSPSRGGFHLSKEEEAEAAVKRCIFIFLLLALLLQKLTVKQEREKNLIFCTNCFLFPLQERKAILKK